jgi:hypothetical protein
VDGGGGCGAFILFQFHSPIKVYLFSYPPELHNGHSSCVEAFFILIWPKSHVLPSYVTDSKYSQTIYHFNYPPGVVKSLAFALKLLWAPRPIKNGGETLLWTYSRKYTSVTPKARVCKVLFFGTDISISQLPLICMQLNLPGKHEILAVASEHLQLFVGSLSTYCAPGPAFTQAQIHVYWLQFRAGSVIPLAVRTCNGVIAPGAKPTVRSPDVKEAGKAEVFTADGEVLKSDCAK